jgi:hypothetical protein
VQNLYYLMQRLFRSIHFDGIVIALLRTALIINKPFEVTLVKNIDTIAEGEILLSSWKFSLRSEAIHIGNTVF